MVDPEVRCDRHGQRHVVEEPAVVDEVAAELSAIVGEQRGGELWHGHVTAVTVAPEFRRRGLGRKLMNSLEATSEHVFDAYFVDLFVRVSNSLAIGMYEAFGYSVYRRVLGYYSGTEDAFDMRKALPRDTERKSVVPLPHPVLPEDLEW